MIAFVTAGGLVPAKQRGRQRIRDMTMSNVTGQDQQKNMRRVAMTSLAGTSIEWYDFFLYATAAVFVFPALFFPADVPDYVALIASLSTFAVGFVARPIGARCLGIWAIGRGAGRLL